MREISGLVTPRQQVESHLLSKYSTSQLPFSGPSFLPNSPTKIVKKLLFPHSSLEWRPQGNPQNLSYEIETFKPQNRTLGSLLSEGTIESLIEVSIWALSPIISSLFVSRIHIHRPSMSRVLVRKWQDLSTWKLPHQMADHHCNAGPVHPPVFHNPSCLRPLRILQEIRRLWKSPVRPYLGEKWPTTAQWPCYLV